MVVTSIVIYPIKGCKGVNLNSCNVLERGFENDRRYMLVDSNNTFVSQRSHPELSLIATKIKNGNVEVSYNERSFSFEMEAETGEVIEIALFDNIISGTLVSPEANSYFSTILYDDIRLVKMTPENLRYKKLIKGPDQTEVSFADGYPYLIAGSSSLIQLNEKLENPVLMDRFRPNIIVETEVPHVEDTWGSIRVGSVEMMVIKPCARCPVVTIDQQMGTKSKETLKTLSTYRKKDNKVYFGANAISLSIGQISVGDEVFAL